MAENGKKWGTIFMGEREASVEQLNAMQEPLLREKRQKEQTEDYMERVRARAADRAREILGAAYAERQKVLEEAKNEARELKRRGAEEGAKLKAEGEAARKMARSELAKAEASLREAEEIRRRAHDEGLEKGLEQANAELHETRALMGQSAAAVLRALERERKNILNAWREDLAELTHCAVQAGTGHVLSAESEAVLRSLVFKALDMLEARATVTLRVNPEEEAEVSALFSAARERYPELRQWIVTGDDGVERGGVVAESGSGGVDLKRVNFRQMVENILRHLSLPELATDAANEMAVRDIVEKEVANITSLTPEPEPVLPEGQPKASPSPEIAPDVAPKPEVAPGPETPPESSAAEVAEIIENDEVRDIEGERVPEEEIESDGGGEPEEEYAEDKELPEAGAQITAEVVDHVSEWEEAGKASMRELEDELFPLDDGEAGGEKTPPEKGEAPDPKTLAEGGFL